MEREILDPFTPFRQSRGLRQQLQVINELANGSAQLVSVDDS